MYFSSFFRDVGEAVKKYIYLELLGILTDSSECIIFAYPPIINSMKSYH